MDCRLLIFLGLTAILCVPVTSYTPWQPGHGLHHRIVKKVWTPWGEWGACSVTCGGGGQRRYRSCMTKTIYGHHSGTVDHCTGSSYRKRRCNTQCCPVDGMWSEWSLWARVYAVNKRLEKQTRTRSCSYPHPSCGGRNCYGRSKESRVVPHGTTPWNG